MNIAYLISSSNEYLLLLDTMAFFLLRVTTMLLYVLLRSITLR